jgi:rod shape-determining protein MreB and related proteins
MARNNPLSLGRDLAIDLGTANTLIYTRGQGIVLDEPSVVAINVNDGRPVAVGLEAKRMMGRTPNHIKAIRPLKDGVIADFEVCEKMLRYFIQRVHASRWNKPRMVICVPSGITGVEQRAVQDAAEYAGARKPVHIIEEPMAAAIGADLPVHEPSGNMVVDIGGGTTEVAVISLGGIVTAQSVRVAGDELDDAVLQYVKKEFSLAIGDRTAEEIKIQMGSAWPMEEELTADIRGRDLISGLPRTIQLTTEHVREALAEPVAAIVDAVKTTLDKTPPELAADIMEDGITITGEPLYSVVIGGGRALENIDAMRGLMSLGGDE